MQYLGYMTAAYAIIWLAVLFYILSLAKREKNIWEELQHLRATLNRGETTPHENP